MDLLFLLSGLVFVVVAHWKRFDLKFTYLIINEGSLEFRLKNVQIYYRILLSH